MVITKLCGGLGNQMFQYSAARRIAFKNNFPLKLDLTWFQDNRDRTFHLDTFNIEYSICCPAEILRIKKNGKYSFGLISYLKKLRKIPFTFKQDQFHYNSIIQHINSSVYLDGYWQSEKYFADIENIIRQDYTFKAKPDTTNFQLIEKMSVQNSVSIHFRRGDYISNPKTNQTHSVCSIEYYKQSVEFISDKISDPHFYIFSDDIEWAKQNFRIESPLTYIDHNNNDYEDLRLMMNCKHNIIANSSFSWWGAWLNNNSDKIVIAPAKWFNDPSIDTKDLIPEKWIRI